MHIILLPLCFQYLINFSFHYWNDPLLARVSNSDFFFYDLILIETQVITQIQKPKSSHFHRNCTLWLTDSQNWCFSIDFFIILNMYFLHIWQINYRFYICTIRMCLAESINNMNDGESFNNILSGLIGIK